jgi:cob(I)alamin adenosyltransferase
MPLTRQPYYPLFNQELVRAEVGFRLSKIYTRTGDDGNTALAQGDRIAKDTPRIEAIGAVDELNSAIGVMLCGIDITAPFYRSLQEIQHRLFDLGGILAMPNHEVGFATIHVESLETLLDDLNQELAPLKDFILPGGSVAAAQAHIARSICRRAERRLISLHREEPLPAVCLQYLNRLSDLLFVLARYCNKNSGLSDILWKPAATPEKI